MPEGDTVHKIAAYLAPRLGGRNVESLVLVPPDTRSHRGRRIEAVYARGKHLFIEFDNGLALRSHLGMYGSWHRYGEGETWRKPRSRASIVLTVGGEDYVCFSAKEVELIARDSVRRRIVDTRLGPDLLDPATDPAEAVPRAREILGPDAPLADVLLDQRIACGIGNVYKSEVLFIEHRLPQTTLQATTDEALARCYATAAGLLRRNLGGGPRVTRFLRDGAGRLWVYGRRGLPCLRCDGLVEAARCGRDRRGTFWCAGCQS